MKGQLTATQFNKEQHKILKELFQDIKISLVKKLDKAIASGAIPMIGNKKEIIEQ